MTSQLAALCHRADDPEALAGYWGGLLRREVAGDGRTVLPNEDVECPIRFESGHTARTGPNQVHLHLTSESPSDQQATVARALELGGRHLDVGQRPEEGHVVLADPEGNEFCVIEAGNAYLAGCGFLGELACDGTQEVGYFWSAALGWPLVWDQDQETAIQSPEGGAKIAWGGPPLNPGNEVNRMYLALATSGEEELSAEVERLVALGATRLDPAQTDHRAVRLADPDGNEFVLAVAR
ncbi:VOC family protein [Terrabacter sp. NPDC080008]|uniref:VOC family protein n=1 Tax=Terrabacter sp. NPDC080008 TaxID=3155176 RepID=UPI00344E7C7E